MKQHVMPTDYGQVKNIFSAASELPPDQRDTFLDDNCGQGLLRDEVDSLLEAHDKSESFLEDVSAVEVVQTSYQNSLNDKLIGQTIDEYRIVKEIGRGGMGVVFLAERETFHQQVALKIIKRGMDSDAIVERFYRERQIMAALNHPFITNLLDGGTTIDGLPFFVMEHVEGTSIDIYCKGRNQTEILKLFRKVCSAVSFAHQKLVVHRDLKPSNILINADGEPKLLDFGIAKLLDGTDASETRTQHRALTPAFASPEHIAGEIVGTPSDVFSLGKILTELLNNSDTRSNPTAMKLPVDLQNVLTMAVRRDVSRRYGSVDRFSDDLRRYLENLPVSARGDSPLYRSQKFVRRNRLKLVFASILLLSLVGGVIATVWKATEARHERELADKRFENLRKLSDSFVTEIHGAIQNLPGSLPARQLLLRRATEQLDTLAAESGDNRGLQDELAVAYLNLSTLPDMSLAEKESTNKKGVTIYEKLLQDDQTSIQYREKLALAYLDLADTVKVRGSVANGFKYCKSAVEMLDAVSTEQPNDVSHLKNLQAAYFDLFSYHILEVNKVESLTVNRRATDLLGQLRAQNLSDGEISRLEIKVHLHNGIALTVSGDYKGAIVEAQTALNNLKTHLAENPNDTSVKLSIWAANLRLAIAQELIGEKSVARATTQSALSIMEALLISSPKDIGYHRNAAVTLNLLGSMLVRDNRNGQAPPFFLRALALSEQVLAADPEYMESKIDLARSHGNLGNALIRTGFNKTGISHLAEAVKLYEETAQIDKENELLKRDYAQACGWLADALKKSDPGRTAELYQRSYKMWKSQSLQDKLSFADSGQVSSAAQKLATPS